ncbi:MAG: hypothetical protein P4L83_09165 [Nevskia sp.]|nr:hypothetical protein [Nevskia sp.]
MLALFENFVAGALLCNSIPHLAAGLRGEPFPSPFASPPGIGNSRPLANVFWGLFNAVAGILLLHHAPVAVGLTPSFLSVVMGALLGGSYVALHFERVRKSTK